MCGIVGAVAFGGLSKAEEKQRREAMIFFSTELLQLTQSRGEKATGISTLFEDGDYIGQKMGVSATEFLSRLGGEKTDFEGYTDLWRKKLSATKVVIGHCRKPSVGGNAGPEDNVNNHPIKVGNIVGVHNGTLKNDHKIFTNLNCGRDGKVDSEAIFRILHHLTEEGSQPFVMDALLETCKRLEGSYACLAFNGNNPYQLAAFRDGRPAEVVLLKPLKILLIASEKDFLNTVLFRYNKWARIFQSASSAKMPILKKSNITFGLLIDRAAYLFDLTKEVTDDTIIADLYEKADIPLTGKIWGSIKTTTTTNYNRNNTVAASKVDTKDKTASTGSTAGTTVVNGEKKTTATNSTQDNGADTKSRTEESGSGQSDKYDGMAFSRKLGQYRRVPRSGNVWGDTAEEIGNATIDVDSGEVLDPITGEEIEANTEKKVDSSSTSVIQKAPRNQGSALMLTESEAETDNLIMGAVKITDHSDKVNEEENPVIASSKATNKPVSKKVDVKVFPEIIERARDEANKQPVFSNNQELADALGISSLESMKNMALYSLGNRIQKIMFEAGYEKACIDNLKQENSNNTETNNKTLGVMMKRWRRKSARAQNTIRNLKSLVKLLASIPPATVTDTRLEICVEDFVTRDGELNVETLNSVITQSDLCDSGSLLTGSEVLSRVLDKIKEHKQETEGKEDGKTAADSDSVSKDGQK
jgi:amidophosphoribosyltransferase